jgi:hypothetical protein
MRYELFIPVDVSGNLFYVIYFMPAFIRVSYVVLTPVLSSGTRVNLIWICVLCELLSIYLVSYFCIALAVFDVC